MLAVAAATACEPAPLTIAVVQYNDAATWVTDVFKEKLSRRVADRPITYVQFNAGEDRSALQRETRRLIAAEPHLVVAMGDFAATAAQQAIEHTPVVIGS